ncbi:MAG TPA: zinc ribbon domain-containing protein [Thermoplasmata archaeon]|nr:zinc ribbon domain-containing protein [Thermoplasmata archaeon]
MSTCLTCGTPAPEGALFCPNCGRTLPQLGVAGTPPPPPGPPGPVLPPDAPPPLDWIPPSLVGKAVHCPCCNTLISARAVVCPVCRSEQPVLVADGAVGGPPS